METGRSGFEVREIRFLDLKLRLYAPGGDDNDYLEWEDEIGFVRHWSPPWPILVGQMAFMKQFSVTLSRVAQAVAIEKHSAFDIRFGAPLAQ